MRSPVISGAARDQVRVTLSRFRYGSGDPTTRLGDHQFWRASHTPDGPGTLHIRWPSGATLAEHLTVHGWGPGGPWLTRQAVAMSGLTDRAPLIVTDHPALRQAQRHHAGLRLGRSANLYHELLPTILGQRITGAEAAAQWRRLVWRHGSAAPGPDPAPGLRLPPAPEVLAALPGWALHPLGIERHRAAALVAVARHAQRLWEWAELPPAECATALARLAGVGVWTIGTVLQTALGDPDAVPVGDYHLPNQICWALAGEPRGSDQRMLELLGPYAGQRGRVIAMLLADGWRAPAYGPRQRILPMARW